MNIHIGDCDECRAFLTDDEGFDVACLSRFSSTSKGVGSDEHLAHLLSDDQWHALVDRFRAHDELVALLRKCRDAFAANEAAFTRYLNSDSEELPHLQSFADEIDALLSTVEGNGSACTDHAPNRLLVSSFRD